MLGFAGAAFALIVGGMVVGVIPPPRNALADSSSIVSIYADGQKTVFTSDAGTVRQALAQAGIAVDSNDLVEPALDAKLPSGFFNVNVYRARPVAVQDGNKTVVVHTASQSPRLIAEAAGLNPYPEDRYSVSSIEDITGVGLVGQKVVIDRAVPVFIVTDGKNFVARSHHKTVKGILEERDVALGPQDTVEPNPQTRVTPKMVIKVNRVKNVMQKQEDLIPRQTQTIKDVNLEIGKTAVKEEGQDGLKVTIFRVNYQNGVERHRQMVSWEVARQPKTKVMVVGTKINPNANPVELGRQMALLRGWTGDQWTALYNLWSRESRWDPSAVNGSSGACGIPQAYPCSKIPDKSVAGQIRWGLNYIADRYGTPEAAWAYWLRNNSY